MSEAIHRRLEVLAPKDWLVEIKPDVLGQVLQMAPREERVVSIAVFSTEEVWPGEREVSVVQRMIEEGGEGVMGGITYRFQEK